MDEKKICNLVQELIETMQGMHHSQNRPKPSDQMRGAPMLMHCIKEHGGQVSPGEISREMGISTARITAVMGNLEKKGWLERVIDPRDRRKIIVKITDEGTKETNRLEQEMFQGMKRFVEYMGEEDTREAIRLMRKLQAWDTNPISELCGQTNNKEEAARNGKDI